MATLGQICGSTPNNFVIVSDHVLPIKLQSPNLFNFPPPTPRYPTPQTSTHNCYNNIIHNPNRNILNDEKRVDTILCIIQDIYHQAHSNLQDIYTTKVKIIQLYISNTRTTLQSTITKVRRQ